MKSLVESRTFWLAVAQAVVGILTVMFTELDMVGSAAVVKSFADISLRMDTNKPVYVK